MKTRKILIVFSLVLIVFAIPVTVYFNDPGAQPQTTAQTAMLSSAEVLVSTDPWITFTPQETQPVVGFIFYPGGKVAPQAYAPVLHAIASQGYLVVDVPMPFNLAVFGVNRADQVITAHPEIKTWVIGGHSLGGVMAAEYAAGNPDKIAGVALWASYPAENTSLANTGMGVISISGTLDGLSTPEKIAASIPLLPADTVWTAIEGGNHAQFGDYGDQSGDGKAAISAAEQHNQILDAMLEFLANLTQ